MFIFDLQRRNTEIIDLVAYLLQLRNFNKLQITHNKSQFLIKYPLLRDIPLKKHVPFASAHNYDICQMIQSTKIIHDIMKANPCI